MTRPKKNRPKPLWVLIGAAALFVALAPIAQLRAQQIANDGRWRWIDEAPEDSNVAPLFAIDSPPIFLPLETPIEDVVPSLDDLPTPSPSSFVPNPLLEDDVATEYVYRALNMSSLKIAPYGKRVFGYLDGSIARQDALNSRNDQPGFNAKSWGGGLGGDWNVLDHGVIGYGVHGASTTVKPKNGGAYSESIDSLAGNLRLGVYGALWRFDALFGIGRNWVDQFEYATGARNKFTSSQWLLDFEFGARFDKGYTRIDPFVNFRVLTLNEPRGAEAFLRTKDYTTSFADSSFRAKLGSRVSWEHATPLATLKPYLLASWAHEFGKREIYTAGESSPFPIAMRYGAHKMARDRLDLGGGLEAALRDTLDLYIQYDVVFAKEYSEYLIFTGFNKKF